MQKTGRQALYPKCRHTPQPLLWQRFQKSLSPDEGNYVSTERCWKLQWKIIIWKCILFCAPFSSIHQLFTQSSLTGRGPPWCMEPLIPISLKHPESRCLDPALLPTKPFSLKLREKKHPEERVARKSCCSPTSRIQKFWSSTAPSQTLQPKHKAKKQWRSGWAIEVFLVMYVLFPTLYIY